MKPKGMLFSGIKILIYAKQFHFTKIFAKLIFITKQIEKVTLSLRP
jgi:hypothetical protein